MKSFILQSLLIFSIAIHAQPKFQFRIEFTDKSNNPFTLDHPRDFLSARSIVRKEKEGVEINESDLPITPAYLEKLREIPTLSIVSRSKWFNDVVIETSDSSIIHKLESYEFINRIEALPGDPNKKVKGENKLLDTAVISIEHPQFIEGYGPAFHQASMLNADYLNIAGFRGEGIRIGVIDAGFSGVDRSAFFTHLFAGNRLVDTYDFVQKDRNVYAHSSHGHVVLSTMAADLEGSMIGLAPEAEYVLLRSEDGSGEYLLEEYFWVEAAEFADSAGVDIINTSLGYTTFEDSLQDHTYSDMDGKTTRISKANNMAFEKGILLFASAGNLGNNAWGKIGAPADAIEVITVGGVDSAETLAYFSSRGPSFDDRIKPDVVVQGKDVYVGREGEFVGKSNGTSFSSPIMASAAACLWQANRERNRAEIRSAINKSADRFHNPDSSYGYGIPNMIIANEILNGGPDNSLDRPGSMSVFPNPFRDYLMLAVHVKSNQLIEFQLFDLQGRLVKKFSKLVAGGQSTYLYLGREIQGIESGSYVLKLNSPELNEEIRLLRK